MSARRFRWESFIERYLCAVDGRGTGFKDVVLACDYDALAASCAQAAKDAVRFQDERDQLAAENARLKLHLQRVIGDHFAPNDCYATGPLTGDPVQDLCVCPSCAALAYLDTLATKEGQV